MKYRPKVVGYGLSVLTATAALIGAAGSLRAQEKNPNIVMLMTDDTGWNDFGCYSGGGAGLGHPTPNVDQIAKEGAVFTSWYGQASCTAGRASFMTGRIPIRSGLSIVVAPGDENSLRKETPTIAEFFKKNGYSTYFSGKWHLGDKPESYPIEHGFDEMKNFAAYYAGVYTYDYTNKWFHPWFPSYNPEFAKYFSENVNLSEWEGVAGQPAKDLGKITYERFATFDEEQADNAVNYIKAHAKGDTPTSHVWVGNAAKPIYFDSIDNSAYVMGKAPHSARNSWVYIDGETFNGARADVGGDPKEPWVHIAWKYLYTARDSWLGAEANLGAIGATYNLTMDPYEKYDMTFNGAAPARGLTTSPGRYTGQDNGWVLALIEPVILDFDKSIIKYPNIKRFPGGASNDLKPDLQHPDNPVPLLKDQKEPHVGGGGG